MLKNHILNDHLTRKQHPDYNETDAYICDRAENVWRINPEVFGGNSGFIGLELIKIRVWSCYIDRETINQDLMRVDQVKPIAIL